MCALGCFPQAHIEIVTLRGGFEECVVIHAQIAPLQVRFTGAGLGRNQTTRGDADRHRVDIGQLLAVLIDAMVVGIAFEDEAVRWR